MSRSKFGLGSTHLTTCDMGQLIPIGLIPVLPGDTIGQKTNALIRVSPLAAPVMHKVDVRIHHFYVANRTIWDTDPSHATGAWEDFITGGEDGMNTDVIPTMQTTGVAKDLFDHFGLPVIAGIDVSELPIRAFNFIFNEFYRDQDLVPKRTLLDTTVPQISWQKDYFSVSRPWASKGPAVSIPLGDEAPVIYKDAGLADQFRDSADGSLINSTVVNTNAAGEFIEAGGAKIGQVDAKNLVTDLVNATGADPLDVRRAWGIQRFMENAARFGSRYPEKMRQLGSMYKGLMDRPEFLGGGHSSVNFSEVLQTANDVGDRDFGVGDMYGHGIAAMRSNKYARRIDEHGYIISLLSVRPKAMYQDGIDREWLKTDREDFHDPYLELIGQQEVWLSEIWATAGNTKTDIWGYSDKYQEYRANNSKVSAEFRDVLDYWHLGRKFTQKPILNQEFIDCIPTKRVFNEQTQDSLWVMIHHSVSAHRNLSKNATPRLV